MFLYLLRVTSGVACHPTTVGVYAVGRIIPRPPKGGVRVSLLVFDKMCPHRLSPAATPLGATSSGFVETLMRVDILFGELCFDKCVQSHRESRVTPRRRRGALLGPSSPHPTPEVPLFGFGFFFRQKCVCHRSRRRRRRGHHELSWGGDSGATRLSSKGGCYIPCFESHRESCVTLTTGGGVAVLGVVMCARLAIRYKRGGRGT